MIFDFTKKVLFISIFLLSLIGFSQEYNSFEVRYQNNIKGDLTFISNQILNRDGGTATTTPENGYNNLSTDTDNDPETGGRQNYNDYKQMQYVNVDPGTGRFNSSTANLVFPNPDCNLIRYAGLYWSATYPSATANGSYDGTTYTGNTVAVGTGRQNDFNQVQLRVPGGAYVGITADEILFDGSTSTDATVLQNSPYACYADITSLITPLTNPTGDYTVANIRATTGGLTPGGGSTGGWTLVIVYENPNLTGKLITTFDGFARVRNTDQVDIPYNGFTTIPSGQVNADIGAATLEGDFRITGDRMQISAASNAGFTTMSNGSNPADNFFNSNITLNGVDLPGRTPSSSNTLGFDTDIFTLNNFANSVIPNNETAATFRFETNGDQFYPYFNSFNIEIIEPDIILEKRVEDIAGNDITGLGVNLGQTLDYVLSFRNLGNDDGTSYTIRDVLPINVTLDESSYVLPTGMLPPTYNPATRTVLFTVPDALVQMSDPVSSIRMRVRVAENCYDFIDACTDLIQNVAYSTYRGVVNDNQITDDPSVTDFNTCGFIIPGATNFLLDDLENCNFTRTVQLCGDSVLLDAGNNFDTYVWVSDDNANGLFDATDTVLQTGTSDTLLITQEGTYIVDKIVADPCKGFKEIFVVERFGSNTVNPIIEYFNTVNADADVTNNIEGEITTCSIDGDQLAKIFLCGAGDSQILQTNITDAQTISWEQLDESSCTAAPDDCANKNATCGWTQVATGSSHTVNSAGKFRLVVTYQNGCFNRFYFDVFQNNLTVAYEIRDIICTTDGYINITNLGNGYGFELIDITNNTILVPFSANNGPNFSISSNGQYRVDVVQLDTSGNPIPNACIFSTPDIGIRERDFQVDITTTPANCNAQGSIQVDILNVDPNYTYILRRLDGTLIDDETAQLDNTHTFNVNAGDYTIEVATDDGCTFSQNVTVARTLDPTISALLTRDIGCSAGMITMTAADGFPNPDYGFAIWSWSGDTSPRYSTISDIPGSAYQVETVFTFGWRDTDFDSVDEYFSGEDGTYVFVVVDANGCSALSNPVTISDNGAMTLSITEDAFVSCSGSNDAAITIVTAGGIGPFTYSIDGGTTIQSTPAFVGLSAGAYAVQVTDSSGCTIDLIHDISEPFPLSASSGVSRDATCDPMGAEVRITNVVGGSAPYLYSFDGGATYGASSMAVLPVGTYTVIVRDDTGCEFPMVVAVEDTPPPPGVSLTPEINYNCDGSGTITATPSIGTYNYTYELDGVLNSPDPSSNVFLNVSPGTYTVRTNYVAAAPPTPSLLLNEDFGNGLTIQNPNTTGYFYENQTNGTNPNMRPGDTNSNINDYEYAVTSDIVAPFGAWIRPDDHTSNGTIADGRFLVINIGAPTPGQIIYQKVINDIIPNQPLDISLWLINLVRSTSSIVEPDLTIELRDTTTGVVVATANSGAVPNNEIWNQYILPLNPGANTSLDLVITTNESRISGNDVAIDDITVYQTPEVCPLFVETPVTVVAGLVFGSTGVGSTNVSCNGLADAAITFEVENFDATAGFEYSVDGGTTYIGSLTSPVTTGAIFGAGSHTILIRKANEITCTSAVTTAISEPAALIASASITRPISCINGGATITASATGGLPTYQYQLEDTSGTVLTAYQAETTFTGVAAGDYIIRVRDNTLCEDSIDAVLTVAPTNAILFDLVETTCYSGANDASIQVNVTDGNGAYTFSINGGPWLTPTPSNATTHTFENLANGSYTINVSDGSGCIGVLQNITINPELTVSANAPIISACATSTDVTITASGGDLSYVYAVVPTGNTVVDGDFNTTNPVTGFTSGTYDVHVRDNNGAAGYCFDVHTLTFVQDAPITITPSPTAVSCFGGADGAINIVVDSGGFGPFEYSIDGGATYVAGTSFVNLAAGTYSVLVRDANLCETTPADVIVTQPAQLVAEAVLTQDYTCIQLGQISVGSVTPTAGGSGNYQYSINGGTWTASTTGGHTFVDLLDGTYSIRFRDANTISCENTIADVLISPLPIAPVLTSAISYNCDGSGDITITPFDASYTYILDGVLPGQTGASSNVLTNVAVGTHTVTLSYGSDCSVDLAVIVAPGNAFEASITAFENLDCNADNSGTITITADNFGAGGFEYSLNSAAFVGPFTTPEQITGLAAQAHSIVVRDFDDPVAGCTITLNQTLTEPTILVAAASVTEAFTCNNTGATITASATGGTPAYEYQLEDTLGGIITPYQTITSFTNLATGDYIILARDTNNCSDPIDTAITVLAPVSPTFTATPTACYSGANDGSILVDVTSLPGNGSFQFSLNSGPWITPTPPTAIAYTFENLANGTYTIDLRDAFGCTAAQQSISINPQVTANAVLTQNLTCLVDASIAITANGGSGSYSYEWGNTATGPWNTSNFTSNVFTTNTDGAYFFRVLDTTVPTACEVISNSVIITPAVLPVITSITPTNLTCNADNSGALDIVFDASIGLAVFVINVQNTSTATDYGTQTSGLPAGNYTVTLTDAKGCVDSEIAVITEPDPINYLATSVPITCDSVGLSTNPGSITISGTTGGTPEYTYILTANNGIATQTYTTTSIARDHSFNILNFGIYQIDIVDANGCASFSTEIIASPPNDLDIDVSTATVNCATGGTAIVTVGAAVGSGTYEFAILENFTSPYSSTYVGPDPTPVGNTDTATFTGLTPGITYTFVVHDLTTNCYYFETADAPIDSPSNITSVLDAVANVTCTGSSDGNISFTFDNYDAGATAVNYEIFNSQSNVTTGDTGTSAVNPPTGAVTVANFASLAPGEYYLLFSEVGGPFAGCTVFGGEFSIRESVNLLDLSLAITKNDNCNTNAGVITATGQFGTAPYEYQFLPTGAIAPTLATWAGSAINVFNGEGATYDVYIKDANNCIQFDIILLPTEPSPEISVALVDECVPEGTYQVVVSLDVVGISPYSLSVNGAAFQNMTFNGSNQFTISNLSSGAAQTVEIQDLNGCGELESFTIQPPLQFNATLTTLLDCEIAPASNAEITIDISAGSGNYEYEITGPINEARTALPSDPFVWALASAAGTYRVTIYDMSTAIPNCSRFIDVLVPPAVLPIFTEVHADVTCNGATDGTITLTETPTGVNPLTYSITPALGTFNAATNTFENLPVGNYTVTGRGANNCPLDLIGISIGEPAIITIPAPAVVEFACALGNNQNNATITIDDTAITGGSNTYVRYEFINDQGTPAAGDDVVVQNGTNLVYTETSIAGGTYIINAYDDNGCIGTTTATILPYVSITDPTVTITQDITCSPGNDAELTIGITITPAAGATNISYAVAGTDNAYNAPSQASNVFTALGIGNYLVTVTNSLTGCLVQTTFEIEDPNTFEIATTVTPAVCFGDDGSVSFTISDLISPYAGGFAWQIYESQGTLALGDDLLIIGATGVSATIGPTTPFAIAAGEYRVEVTQDSDPSCVNNAFFSIASPSAAITANTSATQITCVGNDGVIEIIDVLGGWGDYQYYVGTVAPTVVGDYVATLRFDSLAPGTYQAWVIDQNGCQAEVQNTIVLADPTPINATLQLNQPNCPNFAGEIAVIGITGGQGSTYSYQLIKDGTPLGTPQNTSVFSGLDAGSYTVQINDQWSCTFTTAAQLLYEPIVPLASITKTIDCTLDPGGQITITQNGGSGAFDYLVTFPDLTTTASNTTGVFTTLTQVGDYMFTITDQAIGHACPVTIIQNLQDIVLPVLTIDNATNVTCNTADDGTITVSTIDNGAGPYTFEIISGPGSSVSFPIAATSNTATSAIFTGLEGSAAGITYTIRARGANNCTADISELITQPLLIVIPLPTVVQFACNAGNNTDNATITIATPTGGSGTYLRYEFINDQGTATTVDDILVQNGSNNSYTESNFTGGNYMINVYDDNGCMSTQSATINPFVSISNPTVTVTQAVTCNPVILEEIQVGVTVTPTSGLTNLEYTTTGTNLVYNQTNATGLFTGLGVGNYAISITNLTTGCIVQTTHEILDPDVIRAVITKLSDEACLNNGVDEGSIEITINNYIGNYSYQLYDNSDNPIAGIGNSGTGNTAAPLIISNLAGGVYYVRIIETEAPFCQDDSNAITIIAPEFPVSATISEQASPSCTNDQGSILVDPEGGVGPYTVVLTNTTTGEVYLETNVEAYIFSGLSGGDFDVTITDAQACPITDTITLVTPDILVAAIISTPLICYNGNSATVTVSVNPRNVSPNYLYQLNRYDATGSTILTTSATQTLDIFTGLNAGFYSITASDDVGCFADTPIVQIVNPTEVIAQLIRTSPLTCATGVELELSATGGSGSYEFSEDNMTWIGMTGNSAVIPNASITGPLGAGTYRYYVRDTVNGCASVLSNEISEDTIMPLAFTELNASIIACVGDTATLTADATGGLGNYRYELYNDASLNVASRIAGPQISGTFNNLTSGIYYVNVLSEDCTTPAERVDIAEPIALDYTDTVVNALCFGDENGIITVELSGGAGGYQYAISPKLNQFDSENTFDNLAPGDYTVIAQDQNGCFIQLEYTIIAPELLSAIGLATPEVCAGDQDGTITLTIQGGTAPYSTRLSNESNFVQDRVALTDLSAGAYIIFIRDANGCSTDVGIIIEPGANLNAIVTPIYECTEDTPENYVNIILEDPAVLGDVLYALDSTDPADMQLNPDFRNSAPGSHYIAIAHSNGCVLTVDFEIESFEPLTLVLEQNNLNEITAIAEGGVADYTFYFDEINNASDNTYRINRSATYVVRVIDQNGCEATASIAMEFVDIEIPNFFTPDGDGLNDRWIPENIEGWPEILIKIYDRYGRVVEDDVISHNGWDGLYDKNELPTGDYWYVLKLNGENDDREFVGHFTLYR